MTDLTGRRRASPAPRAGIPVARAAYRPGPGGPEPSERSGAMASGAALDDGYGRGRRRASWPDRARPGVVAGVVIRS